MPPAYVKAYVKRGKTDAADAEAICGAVTRPSMRFVPVKSAEQQADLRQGPRPHEPHSQAVDMTAPTICTHVQQNPCR